MMRIRVAVLTVSDKAFRGEREDRSYPAIAEALRGWEGVEFEVRRYEVVPDEREVIAAKLRELADGGEVDLILTAGGTGLGPRDVTPEATLEVVERVVPGIPEAMRAESLKATPAGMLSRAVSGIRGRTLIINLPGSPKGAKECLEAILPAIPHAVEVLRGEIGDHQAPSYRDESPRDGRRGR